MDPAVRNARLDQDLSKAGLFVDMEIAVKLAEEFSGSSFTDRFIAPFFAEVRFLRHTRLEDYVELRVGGAGNGEGR